MKKKLLVNEYKKQTCYKEKKFLSFGVMKSGYIFSLKVCYFEYDHRFLFIREMENIRAYQEVRLKMKSRLERGFPSHFL